MVYVEDFNTFYQQAEELYISRPLHTRYVVKYKHNEGKLVLKVTDDVVVSPKPKV
jgi:signal recognition particle subunit SRP9